MKKWNVLSVLTLLVFMTSCGQESESDNLTANSGSSTSELDGIPSTTGEVVSLTSSSALSGGRGLNSASTLRGALNTASTGLVLSTADSNTFSSGDSTAMCENSNLIKNVIGDASQPDKIQCYVSAMRKTDVIPSTTDLASGEYLYLRLQNLDTGSSSDAIPRVKLRLIMTDGVVTDFKMFGCFGGTASSPSQSEYVSFELSNGTGTSLSKYNGSESGSSFGAEASATGSVNSSGQWTSKTLTGTNYYNDGSGNTFNMNLSLTQTASDFLLSAYRSGGFGGATFSDKLYTKLQIIGADSLSTLAIGDGSSKYEISFDPDGAGGTSAYNNSGTDSWLGDTKQNLSTASDGAYHSDVNSFDLSGVSIPGSTTAITFSGDEVWDCELPSGASWTDADFASAGQSIQTEMQACENKFSLGYDYIDCGNTY